MALTKVTYVANQTKIGADNLNAIQDNIISNASDISTANSNISSLTTKVNAKVRFVETITLPTSGWSNLTQQIKTSNTLLASDTPHICLSTVTTDTQEQWGYVSKAETVTSNGVVYIKFTCLEQAPTVDLVLQVEVIR